MHEEEDAQLVALLSSQLASRSKRHFVKLTEASEAVREGVEDAIGYREKGNNRRRDQMRSMVERSESLSATLVAGAQSMDAGAKEGQAVSLRRANRRRRQTPEHLLCSLSPHRSTAFGRKLRRTRRQCSVWARRRSKSSGEREQTLKLAGRLVSRCDARCCGAFNTDSFPRSVRQDASTSKAELVNALDAMSAVSKSGFAVCAERMASLDELVGNYAGDVRSQVCLLPTI